jgi:GGDEF domain-containing protein
MKLSIPHDILDILTPNKLFARLGIANKMILGYMVLVVLTVVVVAFALISLLRLNSLNRGIIKVDIPVQEASEKMLDAILAQDNYEKRYLILKGNIGDLFQKRGEEFDQWLTVLYNLPDQKGLPLKSIDSLHRQYTDLFIKEMNLLKRGNAARASALSNGELKNKWMQLFETLKAMSVGAKASQADKMERISKVGGFAFFTTALLCIFSIIIGGLAGIIVTRHICSSIHKLSVATEHIAKGCFDYDPQIKTRDEVGNLSESFLLMGKRLRTLEEMYLDANPLTRLPGGIAIENVLKKRLDSGQPIAFCVLDMDNFKAFNDRYGYAHGSEVIKETARIIENAVKNKGFSDDFVGHVGGDDFVVITTPEYMREICSEVISEFDRRIPGFYDQQDRENGFILGNNRLGEEMRFPLMTISIAIVTNVQRRLSSPLEVSEIAAELKEYAKTIAASVYVVDKRKSAVGALTTQGYVKVG